MLLDLKLAYYADKYSLILPYRSRSHNIVENLIDQCDATHNKIQKFNNVTDYINKVVHLDKLSNT